MFSRRLKRRNGRLVLFCLAASVILNLTLPTPTAAAADPTTSIATPGTSISLPGIPDRVEPISLPTVAAKPRPEAKQRLIVRSSAYSSTIDQTDGDPWTTASGTHVHEGTVATNCLSFGTKIRIPDYFGDTIFTVEDRMHPRWGCGKIDIWMTSRAAAKQWGIPAITIEIL